MFETLMDEMRQVLAAHPDGLTTKELYARCTLATGRDSISKNLYGLRQRGEIVARQEAGEDGRAVARYVMAPPTVEGACAPAAKRAPGKVRRAQHGEAAALAPVIPFRCALASDGALRLDLPDRGTVDLTQTEASALMRYLLSVKDLAHQVLALCG